MYEVVREFQDIDEHFYRVGDTFPHEKAKKNVTSVARINTLSTTENKYGEIYIVKVGEADATN